MGNFAENLNLGNRFRPPRCEWLPKIFVAKSLGLLRKYFNLVWLKMVFGSFNGCGMGPQLVLVSPCFRETVVVTCKIGSFLCSLDNLLQKNVIVFFFENQILKWCSFEKMAIFDLLFTFFSHQGKLQKFL